MVLVNEFYLLKKLLLKMSCFIPQFGVKTRHTWVKMGHIPFLPYPTVEHDILLAKLEHYGIHGIANEWLKSYLFDRKQFVLLMVMFLKPL